MNQYSRNKVKRLETRPEFEGETIFIAILIELEDCSDDVSGVELGCPQRMDWQDSMGDVSEMSLTRAVGASTNATTVTVAIVIAAVGLLFLVPTETGLLFAASDNKDSGNSNSNTGDNSGQQQTPDQPSSTPPPSDQPVNPDPNPKPSDKPSDKPHYTVCNELRIDFGCGGGDHHHDNATKVIVVHHHTTTTKTVHDRSLTVAQQNCMYGALQLGFSSNAQNRVDATYAAILGCFS